MLPKDYKLIKSNEKEFDYMGRIDFSNPEMPVFIYAGSMVRAKVTGTKIGIIVKNYPMSERYFLGAIIDGIQYKIEISDSRNESFYLIAENLEDKVHDFTLFKRQAAAHYFGFIGICADKDAEITAPDEKGDFKIEVYGDSVSAGEVVEAVYYEAHCDPEDHKGVYDNSWFSYPLSLSRKLNAKVHNNSQGGLALFNKTGYFFGPDYVGLEDTYNKLSYVPYSDFKYTKWDFSAYTPDLVIIAIGQNDANPDPDAIKKSGYAEKWKNKYSEIVTDLRNKYGNNTKFLFVTTVLMHDFIWDNVLEEIKNDFDNDNIRHFLYSRNGAATPGHPRITEQEEMAEELEKYIREWCKI